MADITILGLGLMGATLARNLLEAGHETVVWNRTAAKAAALAADGARHAAGPAEAISESPVTVVCVDSYETCDKFLRTPDTLAALNGRVLVQLTSGSPRMAQSMHDWAGAAGASYLDGGIMAYPGDIGAPDTVFLISGDETGFTQAEPLLRVLAPKLEYLGADPVRASAMDQAILCAALGNKFALFNGAALVEAMGMSIKQYVALVRPIFAIETESALESTIKYDEDGLEKTDAYLKLWQEILGQIVETMESAGCDAEILKPMHKHFDRALERGWGNHDVGALIRLMRPDGGG